MATFKQYLSRPGLWCCRPCGAPDRWVVPPPIDGSGRHPTASPAGKLPPMLLIIVAWAQAVYFGVTGLWPILHIDSFQKVTGRKTDLWLVKTVGAVITVVAVSIGIAAYHHRFTAETIALAVGSAAVLAAIDMVYVARRLIPPVYLIDAAAEAVLVAAWAIALAVAWG